MTREQILELQVKELETLLRIKDQIIAELKAHPINTYNQYPYYNYPYGTYGGSITFTNTEGAANCTNGTLTLIPKKE